MSNHYWLGLHFYRIGCGAGDQDNNHVGWCCLEYIIARSKLFSKQVTVTTKSSTRADKIELGQDVIVKEQDDLKERCSHLENAVSDLEDEVEFLHRDRISNNVMFFGVPLMTSENTTDVVNLCATTVNQQKRYPPRVLGKVTLGFS